MSKTKMMRLNIESRVICLLVNDEKMKDERLMGTCKIQMFSQIYFSLHQLILLHHFGTGLHFYRLQLSLYTFLCTSDTSYLAY